MSTLYLTRRRKQRLLCRHQGETLEVWWTGREDPGRRPITIHVEGPGVEAYDLKPGWTRTGLGRDTLVFRHQGMWFQLNLIEDPVMVSHRKFCLEGPREAEWLREELIISGKSRFTDPSTDRRAS